MDRRDRLQGSSRNMDTVQGENRPDWKVDKLMEERARRAEKDNRFVEV